MAEDNGGEKIIKDQLLLATMPLKNLDATWKHMIQNNLEPKWNTTEKQKSLLNNIWPKECLSVSLKSVSTTTRRGKKDRAYPRKGIVKLPGDLHASKIKIGLHQLAAWKSTNRIGKKDEQASHWKCDNERCVNPDHVIWEKSVANSTRYCCKTYKHVLNYLCPHQPTCVGCNSCFK
jgi:hypothetical protein